MRYFYVLSLLFLFVCLGCVTTQTAECPRASASRAAPATKSPQMIPVVMDDETACLVWSPHEQDVIIVEHNASRRETLTTEDLEKFDLFRKGLDLPEGDWLIFCRAKPQ